MAVSLMGSSTRSEPRSARANSMLVAGVTLLRDGAFIGVGGPKGLIH
jgi:hypothetical protein